MPLVLKEINLEARVGIEPTHKGFAVFRPLSKSLKMLANSAEFNTKLAIFSMVFRLIGNHFGNQSFIFLSGLPANSIALYFRLG